MILQNKLATTALVGVLASTIFISSAQARTTYYWDGDGPGSIEGWEVIDAVLPEGHRYDTGWFYYYYLDAMVAKFRGTQGDGRAIDTTLISNGIDVSAMDNGTAYLTAGFYDYPGTIVQNGVFEFAAGPPDGPMTTLEPNIFEAVPEYFISEPFPIDTLMAENDELRFSWRFAADTEANDVNVLTYVTRLCVSSDCPVTSELRSHDNIKDGELTVDLYGMRYFSCVRAPDNSKYIKGARVRVVGSQAGISSGVTIYTFTGTPGPHDGEQFPFLSKGFGEWPTDDSVSEGKFGCNSRLSEPMNPDLLYCVGVQFFDWAGPPIKIAYQDVPEGTSMSYTKYLDRDWEYVPDKEFLFSLITETDCDVPPTTTTTSSTTTSTTTTITTTTAASTTTSTVTTTSSTGAPATTTTTSPTTTSTTVTSTSVTTTSTTTDATTTSVPIGTTTTTTTSPIGDDDDDDNPSGCGS